MGAKVATVTARIEPEIKEQAEKVLNQIGVPISVLIDTLYRQIIMTGGIPYSLSIPKVQTMDTMNSKELDSVLEKGYKQAYSNDGVSIDEAFAEIDKKVQQKTFSSYLTQAVNKSTFNIIFYENNGKYFL